MSDPVHKLADEVAEHLRGTCQSLEEGLASYGVNEDDVEFLKLLDDRVFCCEECSWWCERSEESNEPKVCLDCRPEEEDED